MSGMGFLRKTSDRSVLAELGHSQDQNRPLLNGTILGQAD
jgi:hypothetical protein